MKQRILVTYCTNAGSTADVASTVAEALASDGVEVDVKLIGEELDVSEYEGVVVGGPMILGWHRSARAFLRKHRRALADTPVALFLTGLTVTETGTREMEGFPIHVDPKVLNAPASSERLSFKEKHTTVESYLRPVLRIAAGIRLVSAGFLAGKLDYGKLKVLHMLFVMTIIGARPGDHRNWDDVRSWAHNLRSLLVRKEQEA